MSEISLVDVQVYPDYSGGIYLPYIHPQTFEEGYFNTFADITLVEQWKTRVLAIREDTRRLLVHVHEGTNCSSGRDYLEEYVRFLRAKLEGPRLIDIHHAQIGQLHDMVKERALVVANAKVEAYGHHRNDCVPIEGKKVVDGLDLPPDSFTEIEELSVGDILVDRLDIIKSVNPRLYYYFSDEHMDELRGKKDFKQVGLILDQIKYLFLYCTPEGILDAAQRAGSIQEFADIIGGNFAAFNFLKDYFRLRDVKAKK